ncbi:MAG: hypothetical protein JXR58_11815, partial [Bacteroidales bacterium]|nr:hypothetical protein [Bacteroidales bacterium]
DFVYYLSINKFNEEAWYFSSIAFNESGNLQEALKSANSAIAINNNNHKSLLQRAKVLYNMKSYSLAAKDISMSLDLFPESGESYLLSGKIKLELRDYDNACKDLEKALRLKQMEASDLIQLNCGGK